MLARKRGPLRFILLAGLLWACHGFTFHRSLDVLSQMPSFSPDCFDGTVLNRRSFVSGAFSGLVLLPKIASAQVPPPPRSIDVGGGFDLLGDARLSQKDVIYPSSMEGPWRCERVVISSEGDSFQAESAWKALTGTASLQANKPEEFLTRFIRSPLLSESGVVNDRGLELESRAKSRGVANMIWNVQNPDFLEYESYNKNKIKLVVVQRSVELPSEKGFGFNELIRIQDGPLTTRAVQVKRRYRRAFDGEGNRVVEGLEIVKTFRVLDGVAGTEFPTSTTKSQIRLVRSS